MVTGQSPIVDTQNVVQSRLIPRQLLDSLPMNRELNGFAALTVGTSISPTNQDVGGNKDPVSGYSSIHGSRMRDTKTLIDGMNMNGEGTGRGFYFNSAAATEVNVELGGAPAEFELGGVQANLVPKDGGNVFSGSFFSQYTNNNLTSDNLDDNLRSRGLTAVNKTDRIYEVNGAIGGPVMKDKIWFFQHDRFFGFKNPVAGNYYNLTPATLTYTPDRSQQAYVDQVNSDFGIRVTWQVAQRHKLSASFDYQNNCLCHYGNNSQPALSSPETTTKTVYGRPLNLTQIKWSFPATNHLLFEAGSSTLLFNYPPDYYPDNSLGGIRIQDTGINFAYGAPSARRATKLDSQSKQ